MAQPLFKAQLCCISLRRVPTRSTTTSNLTSAISFAPPPSPPTVLLTVDFFSLHSYFLLIRMLRLSHGSVGHIHVRRGEDLKREHGALYFAKLEFATRRTFSHYTGATSRQKLSVTSYFLNLTKRVRCPKLHYVGSGYCGLPGENMCLQKDV